MSISTYSELKSAVAGWLHRDDLDSDIDNFIVLVESDINKKLRVKEMEAQEETLTLSTSTRYLDLPTGTIGLKRIYLETSPVHRLKYKSPQEMTVFYQSTADKPNFYTIVAQKLEFNCVPNSAYVASVVRYVKPDSLITSSTNDVLTNYPEVYLYGCLSKSATFTFSLDQMTLFNTLYETAINEANLDSMMHNYSGSPISMSPDFAV